MPTRWIATLLIAAAIAVPGIASAQSGQKKTASTLTLNKKECQSVIVHAPAADVAYKPGVDVYGRKVAPADAPGSVSPIKIPDEVNIDIGFNLKDKYGLGTTGAFTGESVIGKATVKGGRVYYDGKPLDNGDQQSIAEACRNTYGPKGAK
ncbi:MAG: hypothetical protein EXQ86_02015 [Rhodospirillales bacterium]|nr:hypothetical protein [Rhodospirillales bacterium]